MKKCKRDYMAIRFNAKKSDKFKSAMSNTETIIAHGVRVEGDFVSNGNVTIDGELTGSAHITESLQVGETARIKAEVSAKTAVVSGEITGNIRIADRLEILETGKIYGDIEAQVLSIAPGAIVNGRITMTGEGSSAEMDEITVDDIKVED